MRGLLRIIAALALAGVGLSQCVPAAAARGAPGDGAFGYGVRLDLNGAYFEDALDLAIDLPVDWLAVTLRWSELEDTLADTRAKLDQAMRAAAHNDISVLVSLTDAPGPGAPDPQATALFVTALAQRYPAIRAVELFPAANTRAGWNAAPDPIAYAQLITTVRQQLETAGLAVLLPAAGLSPLAGEQAIGDMDDLVFLEELYRAAPQTAPKIISLQLCDLTGDPLTSPDVSDARVLRHYEQVRAVMLRFGRQNDQIWVTTFCIPSGTIRVPDLSDRGEQDQRAYFVQALSQIRSQLYIGVTIYDRFNPAGETDRHDYLIADQQEYHPLTVILRELITQNAPDSTIARNGRPKNEAIIKNRP